jgi:ribosomal protein S2
MKIKKNCFNKNKITLTHLINARVYLGAGRSLFYPINKLFFTGIKNKICIFNLYSIVSQLKHFYLFTVRVLALKGKILFVGLPTYKREQFIYLCSKKNHFYVDDEFWIDGLLTNTLKILKHKQKYFRECVIANRDDHLPLQENLKGVVNMKKNPNLLIIFNHVKDVEIIHEASRLKIPMVLFGNSNIDSRKITYLIPGNFYSEKSNKLYYRLIKHLLDYKIF